IDDIGHVLRVSALANHICDTYLTHDSPSVRKTHCTGRKHRDNVKFYYQKWMEEQAQHLIDATTAAFKAGKITQNPFTSGVPPKSGVAVPHGKNVNKPTLLINFKL
ncbi:U1 small nuclear ribonucleoprotein C-like, partial [Glossina fuscipes]|uniref:U1 small nuclear ribonucleoprotein C-like n=1 Tax=Glossina fuscipes TaxID=7396 RepID=A0A9C6DZ35_9MUSC